MRTVSVTEWSRPRLTRAIVAAVGIGLLASAAAAVLSVLPFDAVRAGVEQCGPSDVVSHFSHSLHDRLMPKLRLAAAMALFGGALAWRFRVGAAAILEVGGRHVLADLKCSLEYLKRAPFSLAVGAVLLGVMTLASLLRIVHLFQPMRYDESFTYVTYASRSIVLILCKYDYPNNHIFHTLCVHQASRLFGSDPWIIRLPSLLAGILMVPACYGTARSLYNKQTALLSSCLVACSSMLVEYSTNARGYTMIALFFLLMLWLGCAVLRSKTVLGWLVLSLLGALGFWTVPAMLFPYGVVMGWLALSACVPETASIYGGTFARYFLASVLLTGGLTALAYMPVVLAMGPQALVSNRFVTPLSWQALGENVPPSLLSTWQLWNRDMDVALQWILAGGFVIAVFRHARISAHRVSPVWVALCWCTFLVLARRNNPYERVWLFALPLYLIVASAGLVHLIESVRLRSLRPLLFGVALATVSLPAWSLLESHSVFHSTETGTLRHARELTLWLKDHLAPDDRVLTHCPSNAPLEYYFKQQGVPIHHLIEVPTLPRREGTRLFVVVNKTFGQTLDHLASRYRLDEIADLVSARLVQEWESARVFELVVRTDAQAGG